MPREVIAKSVERDWSRECQEDPCDYPPHALEVRAESLNVEWNRPGTGFEFMGESAPDSGAVQLTIKRRTEGPVRQDAEGRYDKLFRRPFEVHELYSQPLSRKQINHLIKTLRRARDQVFGVDE